MGPRNHPEGLNAQRTRSFKGCVTCRQRRIKCDEQSPRCAMCRTSGIACGGYLKSILFDFEGNGKKGNLTQFRRPLMTDVEREQMSRHITSNVAPERAMWHIAKLDEECEELFATQLAHRISGPFGAFKVRLGGPDSPDTENAVEELPGKLDAAAEPEPAPAPAPASAPEPDTEPELEAGAIDDSEDSIELIEDIFLTSDAATQFSDSRDIYQTTVCSGSVDDIQWEPFDLAGCQNWGNLHPQFDFHADFSATLPLDFEQPAPETNPAPPRASTPTVTSLSAAISPKITSQSLPIPASIQVDIPHNAVFLLKHYSTTVLRALTPYRHSKTPWHILFIPHAKTCLAAITMGEQLPHASLCAFFGMLSTSAWSISYVTSSENWRKQARAYKQRAQTHAQLMLPLAYSIPKVAKYKVILIALLTMIQTCSMTRNYEQADRYFLEAEKFIRLRGLTRRKSRKIRLLHHCYTFERLLYESTYPGNSDSQQRLHVRQEITSCGAETFSYDGLSFGTVDLECLDQKMLRIKGQDEGENDLHILWPGVWSATQYPEIFGIPEIYCFLLSAVIRLGRCKEEPLGGGLATTSLQQYMKGAKEIENFILRLKHRTSESVVAIVPTADPDQEYCQSLLEILSTAMQQALALHFYRKIYDIDASTLQSHVVAVSECLQRCETVGQRVGYGTARLVWPAYIAAKEASNSELRGEFRNWFDTCARRSGLRIFSDMKDDVERIWAKSG